MSSKTVQNRSSDGRRSSILGSLSITKRLTILYSISVFVLLAISSIFLDRILVRDMTEEDNQFLAAEVQNLRILLMEHPDDMNAWRMEVNRKTLASASTFIKYYVRILDENGRTLIETSRMRDIVQPVSFPEPSALDSPSISTTRKRGPDGKSLLLMSAWAGPRASGAGGRRIQIALDMSHEDAIVGDYRRKVALVILGGILCSALMGYAIAREGLRPLTAMTSAFRRIGPEQLQHRIGTGQWPEEIAVLAGAFDKMLERLEDSFTALSQFSADLAHELRTPINNLRGEAEVALYKARTTDEYREVLESGLEEYARLSRMIENLLFLAHADRRDTLIRPSAIDVRKEVDALLEFYEAVGEEKRIIVTRKGEATVEADPLLFRQALSNIMSNAFRYTPDGGTVAISVRRNDDRSVEIEVADTGIGIEPECLPNIFKRFYRTERARTHYPQGTGLGFSIVKSIMDLHGGTVSVRSAPGKGTTVIVRLGQERLS
jgi:two-component system heavy metal sensor histidine kinase CusS